MEKNLVYILHYTKIVIIKQFMPNLTIKFMIHLLMNKKSINIKNQTLTLSEKREVNFHGYTNIDVNEKVNLFNKLWKNMKKINYVPHKAIACDDRDPPWVNKEIKKLTDEKNQAYKSYSQNKSNTFSLHQF